MRKRSKHETKQHEPTDPIQPSASDSADKSTSDSAEEPRVWEIEDVSEEDLFSEDDALSHDEQRIAELEIQVNELTDKYQRALADFQNYQRRSLQNERAERQQGVRDVLQSLLGVLDHFDLALAQDVQAVTTEQIVGGVKAIKSELIRVLQSHGVKLISPEQGDEFDPNQHEAVVNQEVQGIDPGRIAQMLQAGYAINDRVVRPAKVAVTPQPVSDMPDEETEDTPDEETED